MKTGQFETVKLFPRLESKGLGKERVLVTVVLVDVDAVVEEDCAEEVVSVVAVIVVVVFSTTSLRRRSSR